MKIPKILVDDPGNNLCLRKFLVQLIRIVDHLIRLCIPAAFRRIPHRSDSKPDSFPGAWH